jgi:hypothetical protein
MCENGGDGVRIGRHSRRIKDSAASTCGRIPVRLLASVSFRSLSCPGTTRWINTLVGATLNKKEGIEQWKNTVVVARKENHHVA